MSVVPTGNKNAPQGALDIYRMIETYAWWRRPFSWLCWHTPIVRWLARKIFKVNPYRRVLAAVSMKQTVQDWRRDDSLSNKETSDEDRNP